MKALIVDVETTGLDPKKDRVTDIAWCVTDSQFNAEYSEHHMMYDTNYPTITPEITKLTGITLEMLASAEPPEKVMAALDATVKEYKPTHLIAYNSEFDSQMLLAEIHRGSFGMMEGINQLVQTPWLCAMIDVEDNYNYKCWKLSHLALDKGVAVNPKDLHRAIGDVLLTRQLLEASRISLTDLIEFNNEPWVVVRALTRPPWEDQGKSSGEAKKRGYTWEQVRGDQTQTKYEKCWVKRIKQKQFEREARECPLPVLLLK